MFVLSSMLRCSFLAGVNEKVILRNITGSKPGIFSGTGGFLPVLCLVLLFILPVSAGNSTLPEIGMGHIVWEFPTNNTVSSSPLVENGIVYFGSEDGNFYAVSAETGKPVWIARTGRYISSSPAISEGIVYVGSGDGNIHAFDAISGYLVWSYRTGAGISSSPAISGRIVYVGSEDGNLYALDAATGTLLWNYTTGSYLHSSPAIANGTVYIGSYDRNLYAIDAVTGKKIWSATTGNTILSSPSVSDGLVYIGSYDSNLYAFHSDTGKEAWRFATGGPILSSPVVSGETVYTGSSDGNLYALDAATGAVTWSAGTGGRVDTTPLVSEGIIYFGSSDGTFSALNVTTGNPVWQYPVGSPIRSSPAISGGVLYLGSDDHYLYALSNLPPVSDFTADITNGITPFSVKFTDNSTGSPTAWYWDFGDGDSTNATMQNPIHSYAVSGTFPVSLTVINGGGNATTIKEGYISTTTILPPPPVADFIVSGTDGWTPFSVKFTDRSTGKITSWYWDFGDGNTSNKMSPGYTYLRAGNYTVTLTVKNAGGNSSKTLETPIIIQTQKILPDPSFITNETTGHVPLAIQFNDTSAGPDITGWAWDFNDDRIIDSTDKDPVCVYKKAGNYTVNLTVTNEFGSMTYLKSRYIRAVSRAPVVSFNANNKTGLIPLAVQFNDTSTGENITGWAWDFNGDGTIDSTDKDPVCVYQRDGNFTVSLTATNTWGSTTISQEKFIRVGGIVPFAGFTAQSATGIPPFTVQFNDTSTGENITGWAWDFNGDGTIDSTEQNPVCIYKKTGFYNVSLAVSNGYGTDFLIRTGYILVTNGITADFTTGTRSGNVPLQVNFEDTSNGENITGWAWDFNGDGTIDSREQNPVCVYRKPGNYTVNLIVTNNLGSQTVTKTDFIQVNDSATITVNGVNFTVTNATGIAPLTVLFKDASTASGITDWAWDFNNDGKIDSSEQSPTCVYKNPGNYTVNLTITNTTGTYSIFKPDLISVSSGVPTARFAVNHASGIVPFSVQFRDTSYGANATSWAWDFNNDGKIDSTEQNPVCVYKKPGTYTVSLTVSNAYGSNTTAPKGFITVTQEGTA